jgi:hypothetical protein
MTTNSNKFLERGAGNKSVFRLSDNRLKELFEEEMDELPYSNKKVRFAKNINGPPSNILCEQKCSTRRITSNPLHDDESKIKRKKSKRRFNHCGKSRVDMIKIPVNIMSNVEYKKDFTCPILKGKFKGVKFDEFHIYENMNGTKRLNGLYFCPMCKVRHGIFLPTKDDRKIIQLEEAFGVQLLNLLEQNNDIEEIQPFVPVKIINKYPHILNENARDDERNDL